MNHEPVFEANFMSHEVNPRGASPPRQTHAARALGPKTDSAAFCPILAHSDVNARPRGAHATRRRWPMATAISSRVCRTTLACPARRAAAPRGLGSASRQRPRCRPKKNPKGRRQRVARGGLWRLVGGAPGLSGGAAATMGAVVSCALVEGSGGSPLDLALALAALGS